MHCPQCKSAKVIRYGTTRNKQRYICKACNSQFVQAEEASAYEQMQKRHALILYLQSCSYRSIASLIGSTHVSVSRWAKNWQNISALQKENAIEIIEKKEMLSFIQAKQKLNNYKLLLIDLETGVAMIG